MGVLRVSRGGGKFRRAKDSDQIRKGCECRVGERLGSTTAHSPELAVGGIAEAGGHRGGPLGPAVVQVVLFLTRVWAEARGAERMSSGMDEGV